MSGNSDPGRAAIWTGGMWSWPWTKPWESGKSTGHGGAAPSYISETDRARANQGGSMTLGNTKRKPKGAALSTSFAQSVAGLRIPGGSK